MLTMKTTTTKTLRTKTHSTVAGLVVGIACLGGWSAATAASALLPSGAIAGIVSDPAGIPRMGASVFLYNRQDRFLGKSLTDSRGEFLFASLLPDTYSIRVTLAAFVPAMRKDILVQPGMRSVLNVNLSSLFSTIQISYPALDNGLISDEWKWVLRSAPSTRPVMRFVDVAATSIPRLSAFSDTRGMLKVSAGEGGMLTGVGSQADLGTAFALATSLYGANTLQVSGNVGYGSQSGVPTAAFRTSYSRNIAGASPELSVTMRQMFLPSRLAAALNGNESTLSMMRTMSAGIDDHVKIADNATLQYGVTMDAVTFLEHLNYVSHYARLSYDLGNGAELDIAYTSGNARPDLGGSASEGEDADLQRDISTLGVFPNVSVRSGQARVQRGQEYELTYSRKVGSRTYYLSAYRETIANAALSLVAPAGLYGAGDILPDVFSGNSIFNAGGLQSNGYTAAVTQNFGEHVSATVMYGSMGALTAENGELVSNSPDELRSMIRAGRRQAATTRVAATIPKAGTHMFASYQWSNDHRSAMAGNLYSTAAIRQTPGLNLYIRQPIPGFSMLPWRMEATADLRNMLAQGYLPINMAGGQSVLLVETARSFRGGLSFIF
jgi:hypothetical protein